MRILAIEKENEGIFCDNEEEVLEMEARDIERLIKCGDVKETYFTEKNIAILMLEVDSVQEAVNILNSLPLVTHGLSRFDVMELNAYTGFKRLLKSEAVLA